ncbi:MAG: PIN/TRAM domain-containing protein [Christensenellales bacterium]
MSRKFIRLIIAIIGAAMGAALVLMVFDILNYFNVADLYIQLSPLLYSGIFVVACMVGGILFYVFSTKISDLLLRKKARLESRLKKMHAIDMVSGCVGLIVGLVIALLITTLFKGVIKFAWLEIALSLIVYLGLAETGWNLGSKRGREIVGFLKRSRTKEDEADMESGSIPKVVDTNVLIDGRIFDICKTGFVEGPLVVPGFVLSELRHIADSSDSLKRVRGRRGLDILHGLQTELDMPVIINENRYEDITEVDNKLLHLCQELNGCILTNDYNLNKVAEVKKIKVLNINELANAVKPIALPGETLKAKIVKEGKENGQGLAYFDDGTMIVVENGKEHIGSEIEVMVTTILQTAAGRMIFAKPHKTS